MYLALSVCLSGVAGDTHLAPGDPGRSDSHPTSGPTFPWRLAGVCCLLVILGSHVEAPQEDVGVPQVAVGPPLSCLVPKFFSDGQALRTQIHSPRSHSSPGAQGRWQALPPCPGWPAPGLCAQREPPWEPQDQAQTKPGVDVWAILPLPTPLSVHSPPCGRSWPPRSSPAGSGCCPGCRRPCPGLPGRPAPSPGTGSSWGPSPSEPRPPSVREAGPRDPPSRERMPISSGAACCCPSSRLRSAAPPDPNSSFQVEPLFWWEEFPDTQGLSPMSQPLFQPRAF